MTLEEEITVDLMIEEIVIETIDSVEETDLDLALQETIELHKDKATMTSEEDQERDPDPAAEMHLHTVENGIGMRTDILSEEAWLTTEAEAQTENRAAEDPTMTEEVSFQIPSHTARDLPTEEREAEAVAEMTTTVIDAQWEVTETDSKEDLKAVARMASNMAALGRESTTVTASTATKRVTSLSTVVLLEEREEEVAIVVDTVEMIEAIEAIEAIGEAKVDTAAAAVAAEATITIGKTEEEIEEVKIEDKTTLATVSESVE